MQKYKVLKPIALYSGEIKLSEKQAARRKTMLKKKKDGLYEIVSKTMFKAGEVIAIPNVAKGLLEFVKPIGKSIK